MGKAKNENGTTSYAFSTASAKNEIHRSDIILNHSYDMQVKQHKLQRI